MANKKRENLYYESSLGRYSLNRGDILQLEKILRVYADVYEKKKASIHGGLTSPPEGRKHMPRKYADMHIKIGRFKHKLPRFGWGYMHIDYTGVQYIYDADSVKFLDKSIKKARYFEISCSPGIRITFSPLKTTIGAQMNYATGVELKAMREAVEAVEFYLLKRKNSFLNFFLNA